MTDTDTATTATTIRYLSPPEYIKAANARDHKARHAVELRHFFAHLQNEAGLLREVPENRIGDLIDNYLDSLEPGDG